MSVTPEELYELLPAIYRIRDAEQGEPLKALIGVIAEQARVMEEDIEGLYENWFIETCQEWVAPYIGDLIKVRGLHTVEAGTAFSQRARVANTIGYRRRKGTATMLEQLARDTTGWNARAVEFFELLGWTQYYNHPRLHNHRTPDLRRTNELELLNTAFDTIAHTVDVRHIASGRGRHNIANVGLFLWRLQAYYLPESTPRPVVTPSDGRYTFSPLPEQATPCENTPLFNRPQTEKEITHLAEEINVPGRLRRRPLYDELEARRQALIDDKTPIETYFGDQPVLRVFVQDTPVDSFAEVPPEEILICNLSDPPAAIPEGWRRPPVTKAYLPEAGGGAVNQTITVAVDPVLGRLAFPDGVVPERVKVSYAYGFSGDVGGGPYNRGDSVTAALSRDVDWQVGVSKEATPVGAELIFETLTDAITEWKMQPAGTVGVIAIMDNCTYEEDLTGLLNRIEIPEGSLLLVVAAEWPAVPLPGGAPGQQQRVVGQIEPDERRAHLIADVEVMGTAPASSQTPGTLVLDGLLVEGRLEVLAEGNLGSLRLAHTTLAPEQGGLEVSADNERLEITLVRSICGPINLAASISALCLDECIVDHPTGLAIDADETPVDVQKSTIFGETRAQSLDAGNAIFTHHVEAVRRQIGCVRFCYLPDGSPTPRRFRCQPDLALAQRADELELDSVADLLPTERGPVLARVQPGFTSTCYGDPGYAQLSLTTTEEIRTGAEDGSEMGVFSFLKQPQRAANLRASLDEYLRFGLEAGLIYVT